MAFTYSRPITIDHTKVPGDLSDFPVMISGVYAYLKTVANGGKVQSTYGFDIGFFADEDLTVPLDFMLKRYVATTGDVAFSVRLDNILSAEDSVIYIAYGDAGVTTDQSSTNTFSNSIFNFVWQLGDGTDLNAADATINANDGTISGATAAAGKIGGGASFDGTDDKISISGFEMRTSQGTVSLWWKPTEAVTNSIPIFTARNASPVRAFDIYAIGGTLYAGWYDAVGGDKRVAWAFGGNIVINEWHKIALNWSNGETTELFVNNVSRGTTSNLDVTWDTSGVDTNLGLDSNSSNYASQIIDELRVCRSLLSEDWLTTEYNNESDPATFYSIGAESGGTASTTGLLAFC